MGPTRSWGKSVSLWWRHRQEHLLRHIPNSRAWSFLCLQLCPRWLKWFRQWILNYWGFEGFTEQCRASPLIIGPRRRLDNFCGSRGRITPRICSGHLRRRERKSNQRYCRIWGVNLGQSNDAIRERLRSIANGMGESSTGSHFKLRSPGRRHHGQCRSMEWYSWPSCRRGLGFILVPEAIHINWDSHHSFDIGSNEQCYWNEWWGRWNQ